MRTIRIFQRPKPITLRKILGKKKVMARLLKKLPVELFFLHGSIVRNHLKPLSDVDVAVLFKRKYTLQDYHQLREGVSQIIGREDVDLGVLNSASPLFAMQVLRKGVLLFSRNPKILNEFRYHTIKRFLATGHLRETFNAYVDQAILGGSHVAS